MAVSLESLLALIPEENRHLLDRKMDDRPKLATIAKSIRDWPTVAQYLPGIRPNDIEAIKYDNPLSLDQQKIGLLDKWKERNGPMATYRQLAKCLHKAEVIGSVHALCMELGAPENAMIATTAPEWPAAHHTPPPATPPQPQPQVLQLPPPTMKDLTNLVRTTNPYELGLKLNIAENDLNIMQLDHRNDFGSQLRHVLTLYLRQTEVPSWVQVATALRDMKEMRSAKAIQEKFGFSLPGQPESAAAPASATPLVPALSSGYQQSPAQYPAVQGLTSFPAVVPTSSQSAAMPPQGFQQQPPYYVNPYYPPPPGYPPYGYGNFTPPQGHPFYYQQQPTQPQNSQYSVGPGPPLPGHAVPPTAGLQPPAQPPASNTAAVLVPATTTTAPTLTPAPGQATATVPAQPPQNFQKTVKRSDRVVILGLQQFSTPSGHLNILQQVGTDYKPMLGNILLKSPNGKRVQTIETTFGHNVDNVVYDIFQKWSSEDGDCTWGKLVQCLRESNLNPLANDIDSYLL